MLSVLTQEEVPLEGFWDTVTTQDVITVVSLCIGIIGLIATVYIARANIKANAIRSEEDRAFQATQKSADRHHQERMLTLQLDRERGAGQHSIMHRWISAVVGRASTALELMHNSKTPEAVVEASGASTSPLAQGLDYIDDSIAKTAWTKGMRDAVKEFRYSYVQYQAAIARIGQYAEINFDSETHDRLMTDLTHKYLDVTASAATLTDIVRDG